MIGFSSIQIPAGLLPAVRVLNAIRLFILKRVHPLIFILILGFALRFSLSWHPGYGFDSGVYMGWTRSAVELGLANSYSEQIGHNMLPDYPPFSLEILYGAGHIYRWFIDDEFDVYALKFLKFIKTPAMLTDMFVCIALFFIVRRWKSRRHGITAAIIYALHPTAIFDSAIWGQTDVIYSFLMLCALGCWAAKKRDASAVFLALSILTKIQAIVLFPLFGFMVIRDLRQLLRFATVGIITVLVVLIPFMLENALEDVFRVYFNAVGAYANVAVGAYNFWWAMLADRAWQIKDTVTMFGPLNYHFAGLGLFGLSYLFILWIFRKALFKQSNTEALFVCASLLAAAFFMFLTQMHERYMFPYVVLGVPMIFINRRFAMIYWIATIAFWFNLMGVLPVTAIDKGIYAEFDSFDVFLASTQVWMYIFLLVEAYKRYAPPLRESWIIQRGMRVLRRS